MARAEVVDGRVRVIKLETRRSRTMGYATYVPHIDDLIVDSGFVRAQRDLAAALDGQTFRRVVNTHAHEDHFGNNAFLTAKFGAQLLAPAASIPEMQHPERVEMRWYQRFVWGVPAACVPTPVGDVVETDRHRLEVISTPGHSHDHVCLYERERGWLFTGDLFLSVKVRLARPFENANDLLESLRRVRTLEPKILFCYHRGVIHDAVPQLDAKIQFMEDLQGRVSRERERGTGAADIARALLGRDPLVMRLLTGGDFAKRHLVLAFFKASGEGYENPAS